MVEPRGPNILSREVLPPQHPTSGLGVAIVASVAMLFAVGSSAFVVRARMVKQRCPSHLQAPPASEWTTTYPPALPHESYEEPPCGTPAYQRNPDGSVIVIFSKCPAGSPGADLSSIRSADPPSIEVGHLDW